FYFFFSSRRRHTRLQGDWSSDVCSSDLLNATQFQITGAPGTFINAAAASPNATFLSAAIASVTTSVTTPNVATITTDLPVNFGRSEERRVGKEWRSRWWGE